MTEGPQDVSEIDLKNLLGYALENVFKSKENDVKVLRVTSEYHSFDISLHQYMILRDHIHLSVSSEI